MSKKYQPSNGSEGEFFIDQYCMKCVNCDPDPDGEKQCEILMRSLSYSVKDPEYPSEWIYGEDGKPTCTAHKYHDWNTGEPKEVIIDPNQTKLFE